MSTSTSADPPYPDIQKGSSLMIAYRLQNRPVLLIGGGLVASGRLFFLLETGAHVTVISPYSGLHPETKYRIEVSNPSDITYLPREYTGLSDPIKVDNFAMVLTAIDDVVASRQVCDMCRECNVPVNVADIPPSCDFYFGAQIRKGPLQIMISTGGQGPKIGAMMKEVIREALPDDLEAAIEGVGKLRGELRERAPGVGGDLGRKRMDWMIGVCDAWGLEDMVRLRDEGVRRVVLDEGWEKGRVVGPEEAGGQGRGVLRTIGEKWRGLGDVGVGLSGVALGSAIGVGATLVYLRNFAR